MIEVSETADGGMMLIFRVGARELTLVAHPKERKLRAVTQVGDERPVAKIPMTASDVCILAAWLQESGDVSNSSSEKKP